LCLAFIAAICAEGVCGLALIGAFVGVVVLAGFARLALAGGFDAILVDESATGGTLSFGVIFPLLELLFKLLLLPLLVIMLSNLFSSH
jgi:hypothetical protein